MADQYILKVTAGTSYEEKDQKPVHVNSEQAIHVSSSHLDADITIRVQNFRGLPKGSPSTSPYFSRAPHNHDLYSLQFSFTPKSEINGHDLIFGNDFDHPIRDKLPPGFDQAFKIVKWFIDPGLYADVYADEPYLYGPLLSSINTFRIGSKGSDHGKKGSEEEVEAFTEGAEGDGEDVRHEAKLPADAAARKKYFLTEQHLKGFNFESGRQYSCDFFNPYLDFNGSSSLFPSLHPSTRLTSPSRLCPETARVQSHPRHYDPHHQLLGRATTPVSISHHPIGHLSHMGPFSKAHSSVRACLTCRAPALTQLARSQIRAQEPRHQRTALRRHLHTGTKGSGRRCG